MSEMDTSLTGFIANVKNKGLSVNTHYTVLITQPKSLEKSGKEFNTPTAMNKYILFCDATELPSTSLTSVDTSVFGEAREMPTQRSYGTLPLSFYLDVDLQIKLFFDSWINTIINPITRTHGYYNDYTTTVEIIVYDVEHNPRYKMQLFECYPKDIASIGLSYAPETTPMSMNVTLQYHHYRIFDIKGNQQLEQETITAINAAFPNILGSNVQQGKLNGQLYSTNPTTYQDSNGVWHVGSR